MQTSRTTSTTLGGGTDARALALALGLGLLAGLVTGPNLTLLAVLLCVVLLNVHTRTFIFAWGAAWTLSWPLRPVTGGLGRLLLEDTWCADVLRRWDESLVPVMLDWHRYTTFGGLLLGSAVATAAIWRVYSSLAATAPTFSPTDSETAPRKTFEMRLYSHLRRMMIPDGCFATVPVRWTRPWGIPSAAVCLCLVALLASWIAPISLRRSLVERVSLLNGAEVTAGELNLELSTGKLTIDDLRLADPAALDHDRWRVGRVEGTLNIGLLARGRLDFETLKLSGIRENVLRAELAQLCGDRTVRSVIQELDEPVLLTPSAVEMSSNARTSEISLSAMSRDWSSLAERLQLVRRVVCGVEGLRNLEMVAANHSQEIVPTRGRARLHVGELTVTGFARRWGFGPKSHLTLKYLSSDPTHGARATELNLVAPELATDLRATLSFDDDSPRHAFEVDVYDLPLVRAGNPDGIGRFVTLSGGVADLRCTGTCDRDGFQLSVRAEARGVDAHLRSEESLAGVSPVAWNEALRRLNPLRGAFTIGGKWSSPRIAVEDEELLADLKAQLRAANELALLEVFERQRAQSSLVQTEASAPQATVVKTMPENETKPVAAATEEVDDRYAQYRRYETDTAVAQPVAHNTAPATTAATETSPASAAPVATASDNPLFQQMVPAASQAQAGNDGVCKSCMTESDGSNYLAPGTEIHAPQVSIDGPAEIATTAAPAEAVAAPSESSSTISPPAAETAAANEPPLPDATVGMATPKSVFPTLQSQAAAVYRPYYAAPPEQYSAPTTPSQTVAASATAATVASQAVAPASTARPAGVETGYADGVAQALPLDSADDLGVEIDVADETTASGGLGDRARAAGSRVASWTGGVASRVRGWWPRRTTPEERAAIEGEKMTLDPWANSAATEVEAESGAPTEPEVATTAPSTEAVAPTTPPMSDTDGSAATTLAAEPVQAETVANNETNPAVAGGIELEAQRPSVWQRMQFWRTWR